MDPKFRRDMTSKLQNIKMSGELSMNCAHYLTSQIINDTLLSQSFSKLRCRRHYFCQNGITKRKRLFPSPLYFALHYSYKINLYDFVPFILCCLCHCRRFYGCISPSSANEPTDDSSKITFSPASSIGNLKSQFFNPLP